VFECLRKARIGEGPIPISPQGPIFVDQGGKRLLGARHWFDDAVKRSGLRNFTRHDLRHTLASRLVMADVDIRTVAEMMGYKSIQNDDALCALSSGAQARCCRETGRI
jgi:site-specific recombinase XerD